VDTNNDLSLGNQTDIDVGMNGCKEKKA